MNKSIQLGIFGTTLLVALIFVILSATLYNTQWGLFVLIPYALIPATAAACAAMGDDYEFNIWTNFGCFLEAFFWVSAFAVPAILYRVEAINSSQLGWLLGSDTLIFIAFIAMAWVTARDG